MQLTQTVFATLNTGCVLRLTTEAYVREFVVMGRLDTHNLIISRCVRVDRSHIQEWATLDERVITTTASRQRRKGEQCGKNSSLAHVHVPLPGLWR